MINLQGVPEKNAQTLEQHNFANVSQTPETRNYGITYCF